MGKSTITWKHWAPSPQNHYVIDSYPGIGNILPAVKPADLESMFSTYGQVESARVLTHKNCGFVNFVNLQDAIVARTRLNGQHIFGSIVKIGFAKVPSTIAVNSLSTDNNSITNTFNSGHPFNVSNNDSKPNLYSAVIPSIPNPNISRKFDPATLKEMRKKLETNNVSVLDIERMISESIGDSVDLCAGLFVLK
jgi:RNA recognition motif-containing protein